MLRWIVVGVFYVHNHKKHQKKYSILVIRLTKTGALCNSRPCDSCIKRMKDIGINKVYYSVEGGKIIAEKLKDMKAGHVCAGTQYMIRAALRYDKEKLKL